MKVFVALVVILGAVSALNNGVGLTPAMGYNSWYDLMCGASMNENVIIQTMDAFKKLGFDKLGYNYINLDDCWASATRDQAGAMQSDPTTFKSGIKSLADKAHSLDLKFGVYTDRGPKTCGNRAGAQGNEKLDAKTFALWGVDFLKEDSCYASQDHGVAFAEYALMRDSLNATGRPIFFDLCGWNDWYAPVGMSLGNEWRIGPDDSDWKSVIENINIDLPLYEHAGPGGWNNPCLLLGPDAYGGHHITELQSRAQFSVWAVLAAPLVMSLNVRNLSNYLLQTYTNKDVIAVNQDPLGQQGWRVSGDSLVIGSAKTNETTNIIARPLVDGSRAVVFFNIGAQATDIACNATCFSKMGFSADIKKFKVNDLWSHQALPDLTVQSVTAAKVEPLGGVIMLKITPVYY